MKQAKLLLFAAGLIGILCTGCQPSEPETPNRQPQDTPKTQPDPPIQTPPVNSQSIRLEGKLGERMRTLLLHIELKRLLPLGKTQVTAQQLAEIKATTDKAVLEAGAQTQQEKYKTIFQWIRKHIRYRDPKLEDSEDYNSAYRTFVGREAVCQGFSNLLKVMCYTQGINAPIVNGLVHWRRGDHGYGHAWNYVLLDGRWFVSDPTNGKDFALEDSSHIDLWEPSHLDFPVSDDAQFVCSYTFGHITIEEVKQAGASKLILPSSLGGFVVTSFNPHTLPAHIREVVLGEDIRDLGTSERPFLQQSGKYLERIHVAAGNKFIEDYKGILYAREQPEQLLFIPPGLRSVSLKPTKVIGKNTLKELSQMEELHLAEGTEVVEAFAVENCPNLRRVYLPKSVVQVDPNAFYKCHRELKQIRS